jgi:hypothetical protein
MGLIKEPLDIDFFVDPTPLTDAERALISQYIKKYKAKQRKKINSTSPNFKQNNERPLARI